MTDSDDRDESGRGRPDGESEAPTGSTASRRLAERYEQITGRPYRTIVIDDAQGIRALAHAARQQVIEVLFGQERAWTSTELSTLTGLSPSAMSYHLRALEKWGVVERADDTDGGDARSRPWRAAGNTIEFRGRGISGEAAVDAWTDTALNELRRRIAHHRTRPAAERRVFRAMSDGAFWLNDEQTRRLSEVVEDFELTLLSEGWRNEPAEGRHHVRTLWSVLPEVPPVPGEDGDPDEDEDEDGHVG